MDQSLVTCYALTCPFHSLGIGAAETRLISFYWILWRVLSSKPGTKENKKRVSWCWCVDCGVCFFVKTLSFHAEDLIIPSWNISLDTCLIPFEFGMRYFDDVAYFPHRSGIQLNPKQKEIVCPVFFILKKMRSCANLFWEFLGGWTHFVPFQNGVSFLKHHQRK